MASFLFDYNYLSAEDLTGFDNYKYKSIDNSPLSNYVMHPFWNQLVKIFPLWVPANALTLSGWLLSLSLFLSLSYYDPHFLSSSSEETVPRWVWLFGAFCIFCAHHLDGCDGKQARRTNSSSPLGELFDHGLDSSAVWLMGIGILSLFGTSKATAEPWELLFLIMAILFAFYVAHWEKYNTGTLFLPWAYDVSQLWLTGSYFYTFLFGIDLWKRTYFAGQYSIPIMFKITFYGLVVIFCVPMSLFNQYKARKESSSGCSVSVIEGIMPLVSLGSVTGLYVIYCYISTENIVETQLRLVMVGYGIIYSNINCRLILAQMAGGQCDRFNILAWPLFPMIAANAFKIGNERSLLLCYIAFLTVAQLHYGINVVRQLCDHLNVFCFKVGKPSQAHLANGCTQKNGKPYTNGISHSNRVVHSNNAILNGKVAQN